MEVDHMVSYRNVMTVERTRVLVSATRRSCVSMAEIVELSVTM